MAKRDIGAIGENVFLSWCEPEGFLAQKSQVDRLGWDFLLESEPMRSTDRPLDGQSDLPKYLIQVKATEKAAKPPRIKLSALKHLVDADLPAAIVALFFSKEGRSPIRSLLVPVDQLLISETLRRVRRQEALGNRAIHNTTVTVPLDRAIAIGALGEGLEDALAGMLGGSPSEYITGKIKHRQTCGFDDRAVIGRFFVPGENAREKIGELFLGGPRELGVLNVTIERRRFGIALENDREHFREAVVEVNAPPLMSTTIEIASDAGEWVSMEVQFFAPPPFEGKVGSTARFANTYFEFVIDFEQKCAGLTFNYAGGRSVGLEEAISIIEVGAILARPAKTLTIHLKGTKLQLPLGPEEGPFQHWLHAAPVLRRILSAIALSGRSTTHKLMLTDFYDWIDKHLEFLAFASTPGVNLIFPRWPDDSAIDGQGVILAPFSLEFSGAQYTALIEIPIQSASRTEKEIALVGGQPRIVADVARASGSDTTDFIETAIETTKPTLVAGGFENWHAVVLSVS